MVPRCEVRAVVLRPEAGGVRTVVRLVVSCLAPQVRVRYAGGRYAYPVPLYPVPRARLRHSMWLYTCQPKPAASVTVVRLGWPSHRPALLTRMCSSGSALEIASTVRRHCAAEETSHTYVEASMPTASAIAFAPASFSGLRETRITS